MKEKINKKQLLLALTAVCLVGLIGVSISYAYYVANFQVKNPENGNNNVISASTTNVVMDIKSKTVAFDGVLPGHKEVKAFTIRGEGDTNAQPTEASIKVMPNLGVFSNDVTWKLYKSTEEVTCTSTQQHVNGQYYEDSSCNIPSSATLELSGGADEDHKNIIVYPKTETKYYLVVEYANQGDQSNQQGQEYTINLDLGGVPIIDKIIAQLDTSGKCPLMNADGSVNVTGKEATNGYLCKAKDAYGDSYYYRGNVTNNYVKFGKWAHDVVYGYFGETNIFRVYDSMEACQNASFYNKNCTIINSAGNDMYWRIVRINGDGTVRIIYDGTSAHANGEASADRQIGTSAFNSSWDDNAYVGYMYGQTGASTYADAHANTNNSDIKTYIDDWYKTNIVGTTNEQYLADNVFCNDRSISSNKPNINGISYNNLGYGTNGTAYRWFNFADSSYNNKMMLMCPQKNDAFTVSDTTNGNGALTYPVGLLSTDEIVLAGGWEASNSGYYLYSGQSWWASSPDYFFDGSNAVVLFVDSGGYANGYNYRVNNGTVGVRPVFSLKAEVLAQGSGTASDPYRISLTS